MANKLSTGDTTTIDEIAATDIDGGFAAFENGLFKFYTRSAEAGQPIAANVRMTRVCLDKGTQTDAWEIGEDVNFDVATQTAVKTGGAKCGICAKASTANDSQVDVRINE